MSSNSSLDRRRFLRQGPLVGASLAAGLASAQSPARNPNEPLRIGCLNVVEYSHLDGIWAPFMNPRAGEKNQISRQSTWKSRSRQDFTRWSGTHGVATRGANYTIQGIAKS